MERTRRQAAKDLALYLAISVVVLTLLLAAVLYDWHPQAAAKTFFVTFLTALVFEPFLRKTRLLWSTRRFWLGTLALFAAHCGVLVFLYQQQHITVWVLSPILAIEYGALAQWANHLVGAHPPLSETHVD